MSITMKLHCPRCNRVLEVTQGEPDAECNCHLYCDQGSKPSDCTLIAANNASAIDYWNGNWGWPVGLHHNSPLGGDNIFTRQKYCTTHDRYVDKNPVLIPLNWDKFLRKRAPKRLRMSLGKY